MESRRCSERIRVDGDEGSVLAVAIRHGTQPDSVMDGIVTETDYKTRLPLAYFERSSSAVS